MLDGKIEGFHPDREGGVYHTNADNAADDLMVLRKIKLDRLVCPAAVKRVETITQNFLPFVIKAIRTAVSLGLSVKVDVGKSAKAFYIHSRNKNGDELKIRFSTHAQKVDERGNDLGGINPESLKRHTPAHISVEAVAGETRTIKCAHKMVEKRLRKFSEGRIAGSKTEKIQYRKKYHPLHMVGLFSHYHVHKIP